MPDRKKAHPLRGTMILTVILVFGLVAAVIAAFSMLQRRNQKDIAAATEVREESETVGQETDKGAGKDDAKAEEQTSQTTQDGDSGKTDPEGSAEHLSIVRGDETSSIPYGKVDHISYSNVLIYTDELLEQLDADGLRLSRNEIFARHGRMFNDQDLQSYFSQQSWYVARYSPETFDDSVLNDIEQENVRKIIQYEQMGGT